MYCPKHLAPNNTPLYLAPKQTWNFVYAFGFSLILLREYQRLQIYFVLPEFLDKAFYLVGIGSLCIFTAVKYLSRPSKFIPVPFIILALLVGAESYLFSGESAPFTLMVVLVAAAARDDLGATLTIWLIESSILLVITILCYLLQAAFQINGGIETLYRSYYDHTPRYSLGYIHPNAASSVLIMIFATSLELAELKNRQVKPVIVLISFGTLEGILYFITNSRTEMMLAVLITAGWLARKKTASISRIFGILAAIIAPLLAVLVCLLAGPLFSGSIEGMFTNRVRLWHSALINNGISILGQPFSETSYIADNGWKYYNNTLDSTYAYLLFVCGLLFSMVLLMLWIRTAVSRRLTGYSSILLLVVVLFSFIETTTIWITVCGPILLLSYGFTSKHY